MATVYLLPSRHELAEQFAAYLQTWFPGVHPPIDELPNRLAEIAETSAEAVVVFADDLAGDCERHLEWLLCNEFGALPLDRVIDLRRGPLGSPGGLETWLVHRSARVPSPKVC